MSYSNIVINYRGNPPSLLQGTVLNGHTMQPGMLVFRFANDFYVRNNVDGDYIAIPWVLTNRSTDDVDHVYNAGDLILALTPRRGDTFAIRLPDGQSIADGQPFVCDGNGQARFYNPGGGDPSTAIVGFAREAASASGSSVLFMAEMC